MVLLSRIHFMPCKSFHVKIRQHLFTSMHFLNFSSAMNLKKCFLKVNGGWGQWTSFTQCSKSCGRGGMSRSRLCNQPEPANGGHNCHGVNVQNVHCNHPACPSKLFLRLLHSIISIMANVQCQRKSNCQ